MVTTVMSMLIVPILLEVLSAPVELDLKEVVYFAEVSNSSEHNRLLIWLA